MKPDWMDPMNVVATVADTESIVPQLIPAVGITWLYGASMSFKTFVAMDLAAAVSVGRPWAGRDTAQAFVLYVGAEGGAGLHIRRAAAEAQHPAFSERLMALVTERPRLDTQDGLRFMRCLMNAFTGMYDGFTDLDKYRDDDFVAEVSSRRSILVVLDTYSQTSGGDEKENVSAYVKNLRTLIDDAEVLGEHALAFVVVDHATKAGGTYLGSVAKLNDVDSQMEVTREGRRIKVRQTKAKDCAEAEAVYFEAETFELAAKDCDGRPISTLVLRPANSSTGSAEGHAGTLLALVQAPIAENELRSVFVSTVGGSRESAARAFRRALDKLLDIGALRRDMGEINRT